MGPEEPQQAGITLSFVSLSVQCSQTWNITSKVPQGSIPGLRSYESYGSHDGILINDLEKSGADVAKL